MPHEPLGLLLGEVCALVEHTGGATQHSRNVSRALPCIALGLSSNRCGTHGRVPIHVLGIPPPQCDNRDPGQGTEFKPRVEGG